jgi:hypothetical protein
MEKASNTHRLEIVVEKHKLCCSKIRLALHSELVTPMRDLRTLEFLHDSTIARDAFAARVVNCGGCNSPYNAIALAARRGRLVDLSILAKMTWGLIGRG